MSNNMYKISIFMKLSYDSTGDYTGDETLKRYKDFCDSNSYVWFSTDSLANGISKKRVQEFQRAISRGETVEIFFVTSKGSEGSNNIEYKGEVVELETDSNKMVSPDKAITPDPWKHEAKKIWIKLKNIVPTNNITTHDFKVYSTGKILADSIRKSQYHFGYIMKL